MRTTTMRAIKAKSIGTNEENTNEGIHDEGNDLGAYRL